MTLLARLEDSLLVEFDDSGLRFRGIPEDRATITAKTPQLAQLQVQIQQAEELGLAEKVGASSWRIRFGDFAEIEDHGLTLTSCWTKWSPFLLSIDRISDIGFADFQYKYQFLAGNRPIDLTRAGYFIVRNITAEIFRLDKQTFLLVEAMDAFNSLQANQKTRQRSWLSFASVKGLADQVGAVLDDALQKNAVVVPSSISLQVDENADGTVSLVPECPELPDGELKAAFARNTQAEALYSIDRGPSGRLRVVLNQRQHAVVARMKQLQRLSGKAKETALSNPEQFFDGMLDDVNIEYGPRVEGVGEFEFVSSPHNPSGGGMAKLWKERALARGEVQLNVVEPAVSPGRISLAPGERGEFRALAERAIHNQEDMISFKGHKIKVSPELIAKFDGGVSGTGSRNKYLLIYTNDEELKPPDLERAEAASGWAVEAVFKRPTALRDEIELKEHQVRGVVWLQTCQAQIDRRGILLADDMGLGKTLQMLTFVASCIEEEIFPDLSCPSAPFRPVLVILPLILLENETWQADMRRFFKGEGSIFQPVLSLHGAQLKRIRRAQAAEVELGMPVLNIGEIQKNRVVLTTYDTVKNYQHSFASLKGGKSLWSIVITDEAQEYKISNTKVSHAVKAIDGEFHIASTGTPVENRLLDLWNILDFLQPALLGSAREFADAYERPIMTEQDAGALAALKQKLLFSRANAFLLRREKTELNGLPAKFEHPLECVMSPVEIELHQQLVRSIDRQRSAVHLSVLHDLSLLYQHPLLLVGDAESASVENLIASSSKLSAVISKLHEIRARGEKVLVFARHIAVQRILARVISSVFHLNTMIINGATQRAGANSSYSTERSRRTRAGILEEFKLRRDFNVIVLSPFVAGVGLTITEANHVIHYGRWWNPAVESQATDRCYRIGQEKDVHVWLPILKDPTGAIPLSFDERLHELLSARSRLARDFLTPIEDEQKSAENLYQALRAEQSGAGEIITLETAIDLSPLDFESLVACLYLRRGTRVVLTAKGNDGGADVIALLSAAPLIVQVKHSRSGNAVQLSALDDVLAAADTYSVALGMRCAAAVVTNSAFRGEVLRRAGELGITLVDGPIFKKWLAEGNVTMSDVWAVGRERASSFVDGIRRIKAELRA